LLANYVETLRRFPGSGLVVDLRYIFTNQDRFPG
jgi:hypothetical protein